jgi:hypothetical protein
MRYISVWERPPVSNRENEFRIEESQLRRQRQSAAATALAPFGSLAIITPASELRREGAIRDQREPAEEKCNCRRRGANWHRLPDRRVGGIAPKLAWLRPPC